MKLSEEVPRTGDAPFRLRTLTDDDLERIMEIERVSFSTPWKEATFRGLLRRTDTDLIGAEREGRLVGYAVCWTVVDQSELGNVAVAPEARGSGVGRALVGAVLGRVGERGARECFLEVRESNRVAQALYEDMGFQVVGRRRNYYALPTEDALVMRRFVQEVS
ncbi:MAG TPA: ribosomal protein S18-alanine N-acetyltransferase [Longimicrobiaceae bacterium]|nr:ribosomal protein S18-alanine N-acetyltransferase [Longimicrobiaceae bacterium]